MKQEILDIKWRVIIYKHALVEILEDYQKFPEGWRLVCPILRRIGWELGCIGILNNTYGIKRLFPEFYNQKPLFKKAENAWWGRGPRGFKKRIKALEKAIKSTQRQLKDVIS